MRDGSGVLISDYAYDANGARTRAVTPLQNTELGTNLGCGQHSTQRSTPV